MLIVEQIYTMFDNNGIELIDEHLIKNSNNFSKNSLINLPRDFHYCSIGIDRTSGRNLAECHYKACVFAGINIKSFNSQRSISEWKFEIGPSEALDIADDLVMARFILHRIAEDFNIVIKFEKSEFSNYFEEMDHSKIYLSVKDLNEDNVLK